MKLISPRRMLIKLGQFVEPGPAHQPGVNQGMVVPGAIWIPRQAPGRHNRTPPASPSS